MIARPNMRLGDYLKPISSPSLDWITFLTLSSITCSRSDLVHISQLPNIGVLTIGPEVLADEIGLDDGVIRGWARTAATSNAFSMLRVLSCRSQKDITHRVFSHLNQLPALAILNVEECNLGPHHKSDALSYGWQYRTGNVLGECLVREGTAGAGWDSLMHASFQLGGSYNTRKLTAEGVEAIDGLPRLHLSLGGAPQPAAVDVTGSRSLRSFFRESLAVPLDCGISEASLNKRPLSEEESSGYHTARKRPAMRVSKRQDMEAVLMGLGG